MLNNGIESKHVVTVSEWHSSYSRLSENICFKAFSTLFRLVTLKSSTFLHEVFGSLHRSTLRVWSMHWCTDEGDRHAHLWARENGCMKHEREIKGFSAIS